MELPQRIQVKPAEYWEERGIRVPTQVFRTEPIRFKPVSFTTNPNRMNSRLYEAEVQKVSLRGFLNNPLQPIVYGVSSCPNPQAANYFAAFLVQKFLESTHGSNHVHWFGPADDWNPAKIHQNASMLVLSGLTPNTPAFRLDKAFTLLHELDYLPRVVVISGEDPITFFASKLHYKVDRIYFTDDGALKRATEVV